jgi:hypothetical protein
VQANVGNILQLSALIWLLFNRLLIVSEGFELSDGCFVAEQHRTGNVGHTGFEPVSSDRLRKFGNS